MVGMNHMARHRCSNVVKGRERNVLREVTGDHLPEVPSPTEVTEVYLWCWDVKLSVTRRGLRKKIIVFPLTG